VASIHAERYNLRLKDSPFLIKKLIKSHWQAFHRNLVIKVLVDVALAGLKAIELLLALGDVVVVESQTLHEVVVLSSALEVLLLSLLLWLCSCSIFLLLVRRRVRVSSHNSSDGLVSNLGTCSESHTLGESAHQTAAHATGSWWSCREWWGWWWSLGSWWSHGWAAAPAARARTSAIAAS
jgi:hypothetical protein